MALLDICKRVLAETGWPVVGSIASNSDATAQQIFAICNTELRALSEMMSWPHLEVEYPFATVAAQSVYLWPADFRVLGADSIFSRNDYLQLRGSTGLQFWELLKTGQLGNIARPRFRVVYPLGAPGIELTPAPTGVTKYVAVYYSSNYARNNVGAAIPVFQADTDVSRIPERYVELGVKWRFRRAKGLDFSAERAEYDDTIKSQYARYLGSGELPVGGRRNYELPQVNVRENGFGA